MNNKVENFNKIIEKFLGIMIHFLFRTLTMYFIIATFFEHDKKFYYFSLAFNIYSLIIRAKVFVIYGKEWLKIFRIIKS